MDLSKLSDKDLEALSRNDLSSVSDEGLKILAGGEPVKQESPYTLKELSRQGGIATRMPFAAAANLAGMVGDPLNALINLITGSKLQTIGGATENLMTQAGLPEPLPGLERGLYNAGTAGLSAAMPGAAAIRLMPKMPSQPAQVTQRLEPTFQAQAPAALSRMFTEAPTLQTTGALGSSAAAQLAAQSGAGQGVQFIAGLGGGLLAPGAASTAGGRGMTGAKEVARPFTQEGREVISGNVLRQLAADPDRALMRASQYEPGIPGYRPTTAQATRDVGLVAAETPIRALDTTGRFAEQASQANQARVNILDRMAKDKAALDAAKAKRDEIADPLRDAAFARSTVTPEILQSSISLTVGKTIDDILSSGAGARKPVKDAMSFARERLKDGTNPERLYSVRKDLRDAAQGLLESEKSSFILAKGQLEQVIRSIDDVLEASAPGYKDYLSKYAASSRGIERLEAMQDFRKKVLSTTPDIGRVGDFLISQPSFTRAIRSLQDDPKLGGLSKTQFAVLQRVGKDLDDGVLARAAKSPGSDTFRNMSTANVIGGIIGKQIFGETSPLLNKVAAPLNWLYNGTDNQIRELLVEAMLDPKLASQLMAKASVVRIEPISQELQRKAISLGYGSVFGLE
jgi:hypothetical protein